MKRQKKRVKVLMVSLLSVSLLSNLPMSMTTIEAKRSNKHKQQNTNPDNTDVVEDQNNSHSDSNDTNSSDNQHASGTDQNAEHEKRQRQWKQYLGEKNEKKGRYFKELPQLVLKTLQEEKVDVTFIGRLKGLGKPLFQIKKKKTSEGSDVIVTKDHSSFSTLDVDNFWEAMSKFTVEKRAEAGTLFTQALVDVFNEMKEEKRGRALLFTQPFKEHEGRFDLDFLRAHPSDVKEMVKQAIILASDSNERSLLENYAEPMWKYVQEELDGNPDQTKRVREPLTTNIKQLLNDYNSKMRLHTHKLEDKQPKDIEKLKFTVVANAKDLGGRSEKYLLKNDENEKEEEYLWLFKVAGIQNKSWIDFAETAANEVLKELQLPYALSAVITVPIPDQDSPTGTIEKAGIVQRIIPLETWNLEGMDLSKLTSKQLRQLQEYQIFNYLIGDTDSYAGNLGIDYDGNIISLDHGQALEDFFVSRWGLGGSEYANGVTSLSEPWFYNNELWKGYIQGRYKMNFMDALPLIEKIEQMPTDTLKNFFRPYALANEKDSGKPSEELLSELAQRQHSLRGTVEAYYKKIAMKAETPFEGFSTANNPK